MAFRSLFIPALDVSSLSGALTDASVLLAPGKGVVRVQFAFDDYRPPAALVGTIDLTRLAEEQREAAQRLEQELHGAFDETVRRMPKGVECIFTSVEGMMPRIAATASRLCELTVYRHRGPEKRVFDPTIIEEIVFHSGRPLFLVPRNGIEERPTHLAIAWNGSREATEAVALAQPMIDEARKVTFITIGKEETGSPTAEDMAGVMGACGIDADVVRRDGADKVAHLLADTALEVGAHALIMGAFSHSRLRETVLGGVTRAYFEEPPLPLLIAR